MPRGTMHADDVALIHTLRLRPAARRHIPRPTPSARAVLLAARGRPPRLRGAARFQGAALSARVACVGAEASGTPPGTFAGGSRPPGGAGREAGE